MIIKDPFRNMIIFEYFLLVTYDSSENIKNAESYATSRF